MRRGRRPRHAAAEFAASAGNVGAFKYVAVFSDITFRHDTSACDAVAGADAASCVEPEASSRHDRVADDASASRRKDADQ
jgi:hypothetical protein